MHTRSVVLSALAASIATCTTASEVDNGMGDSIATTKELSKGQRSVGTSIDVERHDDCAGYLWKEIQMCCVKGTLPHYYSTGQRGCCPQTLDGQSDTVIEASCPVAQGQANLKPLGDGVMKSQASRSHFNWVTTLTSTLLTIHGSKSPTTSKEIIDASKDTPSTTISEEPTNTLLRKPILGGACGGFDADCQETCRPGWATCEQISRASTLYGSNHLAGPMRACKQLLSYLV